MSFVEGTVEGGVATGSGMDPAYHRYSRVSLNVNTILVDK